MSVEVFAVNIGAQLSQPVDAWLEYFPSERRAEILKYRFNADRNRTVFAELLTRHAIAKKYFRSARDIRIIRDADGKPHVENAPIEISIAHGGAWAVCTVGTEASGVDVEVEASDGEAIAEKFFLPCEYDRIMLLPKDLRARQFLKYWTLKESYFKLTGDENFLRVDCEKILSGAAEFVGGNFFLFDGAVGGICTKI